MKTLQLSFIGAKCQATTPELIAPIRLQSKICSTRTAEPLILTESRRMGSFLVEKHGVYWIHDLQTGTWCTRQIGGLR